MQTFPLDSDTQIHFPAEFSSNRDQTHLPVMF